MKESEQPTKETIILLSTGVILLVGGLAPVGLFQVARLIGINTSEFKFSPGLAFLGMALLVLLILSISSSFKNDLAIRMGLWLIIGIAVLNLGGCASMWSDFSKIAYPSETRSCEQDAAMKEQP